MLGQAPAHRSRAPRATPAAHLALALVALAAPRAALAQPCAHYETATISAEELGALEARYAADRATAGSRRERPMARVAAYRRMLDVIDELDRRVSICRLLEAGASARIEGSLGLTPSDSGLAMERRRVAAACIGLVRAHHVPGPDARACLEAERSLLARVTVELAVPAAPASWTESGEEHEEAFAALVRAARRGGTEARLALARAAFASADFAQLRRALAGEDGDEATLLRALARYGGSRRHQDHAAALDALRALAVRAPRYVEVHLDLALLADGHPEEDLEHALVAVCLLDASREPALHRLAVHALASLWYRARRPNPWAFHGEGDPPPLPLPAAHLGSEAPARAAELPIRESCEEVLAR